MIHSCIYRGFVRHRRFLPVRNAFRYRIFLLYLDLAELPTLFENYTAWSVERFNLAYFRRKDHLGDPNLPLDTAVRDLAQSKLGRRPIGPIRMLTHLRYFGYCFNPVSFYYCYDAEDRRVETIVAEVHNTPWGEEHCYVFGDAQNQHPMPNWRRFQFAKEFHVSPFMDMDVWYDWRFREPGETINVHFMNFVDGKQLFDATLALQRQEINSASLSRVLIHYPFMTFKVITLIHWQALRLLNKGAPLFVHPAKRAAAAREHTA